VSDPQHFGVAELHDDGSIKRLVEKPKQPASDLALVGIYMFDASVFTAVEAIEPSKRGELEITDALQWLLQHGYGVHPYVDMLIANEHVLDEISPEVAANVEVAADSEVGRHVTLQTGACIRNSTVRGPSIIGENTLIENAYVGPYTSIYRDCRLSNCEIEHSIVLEGSQISGVATRIVDSMIGRNAVVGRTEQKPKALKMNLGDYSKFWLP
jgi:glucose-1-phosphate thymidylyltransferase